MLSLVVVNGLSSFLVKENWLYEEKAVVAQYLLDSGTVLFFILNIMLISISIAYLSFYIMLILGHYVTA